MKIIGIDSRITKTYAGNMRSPTSTHYNTYIGNDVTMEDSLWLLNYNIVKNDTNFMLYKKRERKSRCCALAI